MTPTRKTTMSELDLPEWEKYDHGHIPADHFIWHIIELRAAELEESAKRLKEHAFDRHGMNMHSLGGAWGFEQGAEQMRRVVSGWRESFDHTIPGE